MTGARRGQFEVVLVWASDRIARSEKRFLDVLDEFNRLNIEFVSFREQIHPFPELSSEKRVPFGSTLMLSEFPSRSRI